MNVGRQVMRTALVKEGGPFLGMQAYSAHPAAAQLNNTRANIGHPFAIKLQAHQEAMEGLFRNV